MFPIRFETKEEIKEAKKQKLINIEKAKKQKILDKDFEPFLEKFKDEMFEYNLMNKFEDTYDLQVIDKTVYGYYAHLYPVPGLSFSKLDEYTDKLEENLQCLWLMSYKKFDKYAEVKIVTAPLDTDFEFSVPKLKPNEVYLGVDLSYKVIKVDVNTYCMILIAGCTRSGKTRFIYLILLCFILCNSPQKVELYLSDIAKNEYIQFKNVSHVRYYAETLDKLYAMMLHLRKVMQKRVIILSRTRESGTATNIDEFNKIAKPVLSYIYVFVDEASIINVEPNDDKETKFKKQVIFNVIGEISRIGGGLGVFTLNATQKTSKTDGIPAIIKNMASVRVSFRANDDASSEVILGDTGAKGLLQRYAKYSLIGGGDQQLLFTPKITTDTLKTLLAPHIDKNFKRPIIELSSPEKESEKPNKKSKSVKKEEPFTGHTKGTKKNF